MSADAVVGVRTARHEPLRFVRVADNQLPIMTRVIVEDDVSEYLAFVALPSNLLLAVPEGAARGTIVAAGLTSPRVASAVAALDRAALETARELAGTIVAIRGARWSTDRADLEVILDLEQGAAIPSELNRWREVLAGQVRAAIRLRYVDGSPLRLTS